MGTGATSTSGISILFELTNDNGQQCKVGGIGLITPMSFTVTPAQLAAGISIYQNSSITCGTTTGATRWRYTLKSNDSGTRTCSINITGTTNLDTTPCLNAIATPTTTVPTASLFWLLDGSNFPTGNFIPAANGTQALGSSGLRWDIFGDSANITNLTVTGTCTGCGSGGGGTTPTGTGFTHVTAGVQDGAAKTVDVSSSDTTGVLKAASFPALTGDVTTSSGALATTLATVATPGTNTKITYDAKGRVTSGAQAQFSDIGGTGACTQEPALTGDVTSSSGSCATTIAANAVTQAKVSGGYVDLTNAQNPIAGNKTFSGNVSALSFQFTRRMVDQEAGADFGAKLNNCIVNITNGLNGAFGGICDASNLQGFQSAAATITVNHDLVTILLPCNIVLTLAGSPGLSWTNTNGAMFGCSQQNTIITTSSATADVISLGSLATKNHFSDFTIQSAVVRSAGSGLRVSGGDNDFERIAVLPTWNGVTLDTAVSSGGNIFRSVRFGGGGSGAAWNCQTKIGGIATGNVASNSFVQGVWDSNGGATVADALICIQDGSDSIDIIGGQAVANLGGGNDAISVHFELVAAGNPPSNIRITGLTMEGGLTKPAMKIDSVFGMECTGCTFQSSLQGLLANAGTRIKINGGLFFNNQQEGVRDNNVAVTDLQVLGARFCNNGLGTTNTFSDFTAAAAVSGFSLIGNRFQACQAGGNAPKNNVEVLAGASNNYIISENSFAGSVGLPVLDGGTGTPKVLANNFPTNTNTVNPQLVRVASNFTTAANTNFQTITGLSFPIPAVADSYSFHCALSYSIATATAVVAFGIQAATNSPTNIFGNGTQQITVGPPATFVTGTLPTLTTTTATSIVSGTPGAIANNYVVSLDGTIENPASLNTINIMVKTATAADAVTVLRGSYCSVN